MTGNFYVDADEQQQKARWAEQRLLEHDATRVPRPSRPAWEDDDPVTSSLPPVFRREGEYAHTRDTSLERRAARFRDGLPPPPLPVSPNEVPRLLPPALPPLVDQREYDRHVQQVQRGEAPPWTYQKSPEPLSASGPAELTASQKKRLRRKRKREGQDTAKRAAPFPLAVDSAPVPQMPPPHQEQENGYVLTQGGYVRTPPAPAFVPTRRACGAEVLVRMPDQSVHRLWCPLTPFPHPNQPHLVQLASASPDGAEIFLGFWLPGE